MAPSTYSLVIILVITFASTITCFEYIVDFEGLDCGKSFLLSDYDVFVVKADPNPNSIGNPSFCKASFVGTTRKQFVINVDVIEINDCEVKLNFYDNEPTEKFAKYSLSCSGSPSPVLTTSPGNLTVRLDKPSGDAKGYKFYIKISTGSQGGSGLQDNGGGGVGVPVGIGVGVAVFLIIIISIVCFLVCRQMRKEKHKNAYNEPSVFATVSSRDPEYESEPRSGNQASSRRQREEEQRQRERERDREREEQRVPNKLPEPKVNGILKGSPGRRRKRGKGGESGYDNEGYSASVSSTDESADFDFASYKKSIEEGGPGMSGRVKNFSSFPDPVKERRDRRERRRNYDSTDNRSNSQTSESSGDEHGHTNLAFTDETGQPRRPRSLGKSSGRSVTSESTRRSYDDDDDASTTWTRSTRTGSFRSRSHSDSRTEGSRDSSDTVNYESRYERNPNNASIRRSRSRSQNRSSGRSNSRRRHHHHHQHPPPSDGSQQGSQTSQASHGSHSHRHRSRSRDKKASPYLPVFDEAKKLQKKHKK